MTVFISHSFENKPEFENIVDALEERKVPYWDPAEIPPGAPLREALREAVERCQVCIFVATHDSIASSWCSAELGAFWGAGKSIIVYLAEVSLTEDKLSPIVQGDVWERRISKIADRAREIVDQAKQSAADKPGDQKSSVAQLSIEQFEKMLASTIALAAASAKDNAKPQNFQEVETAVKGAAGKVLAGFRATESVTTDSADDWHNNILWVDDQPDNNVYERQAMESMGFEFTLASSTSEALQVLGTRRFAAIISDMGRAEGPREGYVLLEAVRAKDKTTPFFIYAGSRAPQYQREAALRGAQGTTNIASELVEMVVRSLPTGTQLRAPAGAS